MKSFINETVKTQLQSQAPAQITSDNVTTIVNDTVKSKLTYFDNRITDLEKEPGPIIPTTESIESIVNNKISEHVSPLET